MSAVEKSALCFFLWIEGQKKIIIKIDKITNSRENKFRAYQFTVTVITLFPLLTSPHFLPRFGWNKSQGRMPHAKFPSLFILFFSHLVQVWLSLCHKLSPSSFITSFSAFLVEVLWRSTFFGFFSLTFLEVATQAGAILFRRKKKS